MSEALLAAVALVVSVGVDLAGVQGTPRMRFQEMDRNGNGIIERTEWRGSEQSFRVHDWNRDGVLSGDEVRPGARRRGRAMNEDDPPPDREYEFDDWSEARFTDLDHNRDNRIGREEWHFDRESFFRADHDRNGSLSRAEFLFMDPQDQDDDREDRFRDLDANGDRVISREEWHGGRSRFDALDRDRNGVLSRVELTGGDVPPDPFDSLDVNRDKTISRDEWHWSAASFDRRDANRDGRLSRAEFTPADAAKPATGAYRAGQDRGLIEGRAAGREDRERNQGWDLEGQRELEAADSGYEARFGPRTEYQAGYREGFRRGYREGYGPRN